MRSTPTEQLFIKTSILLFFFTGISGEHWYLYIPDTPCSSKTTYSSMVILIKEATLFPSVDVLALIHPSFSAVP